MCEYETSFKGDYNMEKIEALWYFSESNIRNGESTDL